MAIDNHVSVKIHFPNVPICTYCDGCRQSTTFPYHAAKILRECGGLVLCEKCRPPDETAPSPVGFAASKKS